MHTYSVALTITGSNLDLSEVTEALKLKPTQTRVKGQRRSSNTVWPESMWEYEVRPGQDEVLWDSLEKGLLALISVFDSHKKAIQDYQQRCEVLLWCGHFSTSFDGGPSLSPKILRELADLGVELKLETHFCDETSSE